MTWKVLLCSIALVLSARSLGAEDAGWKPETIGFLLLDGVYNTELVAPLDVLQHVAGRVEPAPRTFTVALSDEPVRTFEGLTIVPDFTVGDAPSIDILVVPSTAGSRGKDRRNEKLIRWLAEAGEKARHVVSLCWGAFLLAEAGLLDGGPATTFPSDQDLLAKEFPKIDVKQDVSFVDAGHALTSVGGVESYTVALYLVERLYGRETAEGIAEGLVLDWRLDDVRFHRSEP